MPTVPMIPTRREFLKQSTIGAAALATLSLPLLQSCETTKVAAAPRKLKVLILGGTGFVGPCIVRRAVAQGHAVTIFNRGKTDPGAFADLAIEKLIGDRKAGDLKALEGREWDAVVDVWPSYPKYVREAVELLADHCDHYLFVSTISVYQPLSEPNQDESAPVLTLPPNADPEKSSLTGGNYGALKVLCEQAAEKVMPGQVTVIRPGLIVGPDDDSDRYTYWPLRIAAGGEVLAPGTPDDPVQFIDVRDLAQFIVHCLETTTVGVMNGTGPQGGMPIVKMLEACREASGSDARFTFVPDDFLDEQRIQGWSDVPVWISPRQPGGGLTSVSVKRAIDAGLTFRSPIVTARDTLAWFKTTQKGRALTGGLTRERESAALTAWHVKAATGANGK